MLLALISVSLAVSEVVQIEGEKPQDLTEFGLGNFTELLVLVFNRHIRSLSSFLLILLPKLLLKKNQMGIQVKK
ncbi:Uncharacterised protein [Neisseria dentiae]|nr:Uncharacterised protein [Neisseria dentiae]